MQCISGLFQKLLGSHLELQVTLENNQLSGPNKEELVQSFNPNSSVPNEKKDVS